MQSRDDARSQLLVLERTFLVLVLVCLERKSELDAFEERVAVYQHLYNRRYLEIPSLIFHIF